MENNSLWRYDNKIIRVLEIRKERLLVIDCVKRNMPYWIDAEALEQYEECTGQQLQEYTGVIIPDIAELSAGARKTMQKRYSVIASILPVISNEGERKDAIANAATLWNVSKQTVRIYLCKYHELFDDALLRYNEKQTRKDRKIDDYYEKIASGKQEKPFHEIILQIGNRDDTGAKTEDGDLAVKVLDEYMKEFQQRNPNLRVFSAHLHRDEATPHLHIDFVPFTTGSKRGLETRVSLKQALAVMGFKGGPQSDTEWNQWVSAEKKELAVVMERNGIEWEQKGTHEKHLSVLDYEKKERAKEVAALEEQKASLESTNASYQATNESLHDQLCDLDHEILETRTKLDTALEETQAAEKEAAKTKKKLSALTSNMSQVERYAAEYARDPDEWLPKPNPLESAKAYRKRILPLITRVEKIIRPLYAKYYDLKKECERLSEHVSSLNKSIDRLHGRISFLENDNKQLLEQAQDLNRVKAAWGASVVNEAIRKAKEYEQTLELQKNKNRRRSKGAR